jgi:hypothetical protein
VGTDDLITAVDRVFAVTGSGYAPWPDPHPGRAPRDDEYSRVTDPAKWRIVGARVEAWLEVLVASDVVHVERDVTVRWVEPRGRVTRVDRVVLRAPGAMPLVVARTAIDDVPDAGVLFGVGDPTVVIDLRPDCGCDACDSGSQGELDEVDRVIGGVVAGTFRRLTSGSRQITQLDPSGWSASGDFARGEVGAVLADPRGWQEARGAAWTPVD